MHGLSCPALKERERDTLYSRFRRELLVECGIGLSKDAVVSTHRALVFCQMKTMIDVIINQVLGSVFPVVSIENDAFRSVSLF